MLPEPIHSVIIGSLLGDGCLERNGRGWRMRIDHQFKVREYVEWKYKLLQPIVNGFPKAVKVWDKRTHKYYEHIRLDTKTLSELSWYAEAFYVNNKKRVPPNIKNILVNVLALAIWYMDDGHLRKDCKALRLNTQSFNLKEVEQLSEVLKSNFGIKSRIHRVCKLQWVIYIPAKEANYFCDLIRHYVPPVMKYKLL